MRDLVICELIQIMAGGAEFGMLSAAIATWRTFVNVESKPATNVDLF
jgi:hypothetical protein